MAISEDATPELKVYEGHCYEDTKSSMTDAQPKYDAPLNTAQRNQVELVINGYTMDAVRAALREIVEELEKENPESLQVGFGADYNYTFIFRKKK